MTDLSDVTLMGEQKNMSKTRGSSALPITVIEKQKYPYTYIKGTAVFRHKHEPLISWQFFLDSLKREYL